MGTITKSAILPEIFHLIFTEGVTFSPPGTVVYHPGRPCHLVIVNGPSRPNTKTIYPQTPGPSFCIFVNPFAIWPTTNFQDFNVQVFLRNETVLHLLLVPVLPRCDFYLTDPLSEH